MVSSSAIKIHNILTASISASVGRAPQHGQLSFVRFAIDRPFDVDNFDFESDDGVNEPQENCDESIADKINYGFRGVEEECHIRSTPMQNRMAARIIC
jgi:disulfide oxidoreductase YuzD